jgi:hypothetical protein
MKVAMKADPQRIRALTTIAKKDLNIPEGSLDDPSFSYYMGWTEFMISGENPVGYDSSSEFWMGYEDAKDYYKDKTFEVDTFNRRPGVVIDNFNTSGTGGASW